MRRIQSIKQRSLSRNTMIVLAAVMLTAAAATDALSAGRGGGGGGGARSGHMGRGVGGPWLNPLAASADLQSIDSIHCASIARDPRLAGKSGVGIWQWLKRCAYSEA